MIGFWVFDRPRSASGAFFQACPGSILPWAFVPLAGIRARLSAVQSGGLDTARIISLGRVACAHAFPRLSARGFFLGLLLSAEDSLQRLARLMPRLPERFETTARASFLSEVLHLP